MKKETTRNLIIEKAKRIIETPLIPQPLTEKEKKYLLTCIQAKEAARVATSDFIETETQDIYSFLSDFYEKEFQKQNLNFCQYPNTAVDLICDVAKLYKTKNK
jgi:hypothetical protein